jgi:hypothetical protein
MTISKTISQRKIDPDTVNRIITNCVTRVTRARGVEENAVNNVSTGVIIAYLLQSGATSPRMASNVSATINGQTLTKQSLELACREARCTLRQLARALASLKILVF